MRKTMAATVRVVQVPKSAPQVRRLSLEEEALVLDQAHRDMTSCTSGLQEVNKQLELSDALEDLAAIAKTIPEASTTELNLIATAGQAGVAGTDNEPELMLPAMEGFQEGKRIAFESLAEKAKTLWKNILAFIARLWEKFMAFWRINVVVAELKRKIADMRRAIKEGKVSHAGRAGTFEELVEWFSFEGEHLTTPEKTTAALVESAKVAGFIYDTYANEIEATGQRLVGTLSDFKPENKDQVLASLVQQLGRLNFGGMPHAVPEGNDGGFAVATCQSFLGNGMLVAKTFKPQAGMHPIQALEGFRNSGIMLERGDAKKGSVYTIKYGNAKFFAPKPEGAPAILQAAETLLGVIENFHAGHAKKLSAISEQLKAASEKAVQAFSGTVAGDGAEEAEREFKAALNLNAMYARWAQVPVLPFYSYIISMCRFALAWVQIGMDKSINVKNPEPVHAF